MKHRSRHLIECHFYRVESEGDEIYSGSCLEEAIEKANEWARFRTHVVIKKGRRVMDIYRDGSTIMKDGKLVPFGRCA